MGMLLSSSIKMCNIYLIDKNLYLKKIVTINLND